MLINKQVKLNIWHAIRRVLVISAMLLGIMFAMRYAPGYKIDTEVKSVAVKFIINNNIINKEKDDIILMGNIVYISEDDVRNYFDEFLKEEDNRFLTVSNNNVAVIPKNNKDVFKNGEYIKFENSILFEKEKKKYYMPLNDLKNIYDFDYIYNEYTKSVIIDTHSKKLVTANAGKDVEIKYKSTFFSKNVDRVLKNDLLVIIQTANGKDYEENNWVKVRTPNAKIGYINKNDIINRKVVRESAKNNKIDGKISIVWDYYTEGNSPTLIKEKKPGINVISPSFMNLKGDGKINYKLTTREEEYIKNAHNFGYEIWPTISNLSIKDLDDTSRLFSTFEKRYELASKIVEIVKEYGVDGINVDIENMYLKDKDNYTRFIIELTTLLHRENKKICVDVTAPDGSENWSLCYDRNKLAKAADYMVYIAYDTSGVEKAASISSSNIIEININKFLKNEGVPAEKLIVSFPFYTRHWVETNGKVKNSVLNMKNIEKLKLPVNAEKIWDDSAKQTYIEYKVSDSINKIWLEDIDSITKKIELIKKHNLKGAGFWELDREDPKIWTNIQEALFN